MRDIHEQSSYIDIQIVVTTRLCCDEWKDGEIILHAVQASQDLRKNAASMMKRLSIDRYHYN